MMDSGMEFYRYIFCFDVVLCGRRTPSQTADDDDDDNQAPMKVVAGAILSAVAAFAVYWQWETIKAGFMFDDRATIVENQIVQVEYGLKYSIARVLVTFFFYVR